MRTLAALTFYVSLATAGSTATDTQIAVLNAASAARLAGDYTGAEALLRSPSAGHTPAELNTLADLLREEGRAGEAGQLFREALNMPLEVWGVQFDSLAGLAEINREPELWKRAIDLAHAHNDAELEAVGLRGLGETWFQKGDTARAAPLLRQALAAFGNGPGALDYQTATTLGLIAQIDLSDNKPALAEDELLRAVGIDERILGENHPQVAMLLQILADATARLNRLDQSRLYFDRAASIMAARFGDDSPITGSVFANRGIVEQRAARNTEAASAFQKALMRLSNAGPELNSLRSMLMNRYAQSLKATHRNQEAKALLAQVKTFAGETK